VTCSWSRGMFVEPDRHALVLVGDVVVADQVHRKFVGNLAVDGAQELQELGMAAVAGQALPDSFAGQHVQRREQRGGAGTREVY